MPGSHTHPHPHRPIAAGTALAVLAALTFGVTTPLIERSGRGLGPFSTAALLYLGAALSALLLGRLGGSSGAPLRRAHLPRLAAVAVVGAGLAPALLAWGLQRTGATAGSLLLNLEAVFTVLLAWLLYREPIGGRVLAALALMAGGGAALTATAALGGAWSLLGAAAIAGATAAWGLDNALTRPLADLDPVAVVAGKSSLGALLTGTAALALGEAAPSTGAAGALVLCGATGYGLSLRIYLLAQRRVGAARTGSIFALAPFVGAAAAWALGDAAPGPFTFLAALLFAAGVLLHLTERHDHPHVHPEVEHEHAHRHDDGHHGDHTHPDAPAGEHSHPHRHGHLEHVHDHGLDVHHEHAHP